MSLTQLNKRPLDWMREFAKWVPHLRVVPLQGSKASRDIIRKYELFSSKGELKWSVSHPLPLIKYEPHRTFAGHSHVVLVTYEIITSQKDYSILSSKVPRWECLIVESVSRFIIILLMPANNEISCLNYSQRRG